MPCDLLNYGVLKLYYVIYSTLNKIYLILIEERRGGEEYN